MLLPYATITALVAASERPRILAKLDPLRNVPRGNFTLADYSYEGADLCQNEFGNCRLPNLGKVA